MEDSPFADDEQFEALMNEVDAEMRQDNIPIHARSLQAVTRTARRLKIKMMLAPPDEKSKRIYEWFEARYGDRLKVDFSPGSIVLLLKGDAYRLRLPLLVGEFIVIAHAELFCRNPKIGNRISIKQKGSPPSLFNPLNFIEGMTPAFASSLSFNEQTEISDYASWGLDCYRAIKSLKKHDLIESALGDINDSVEKIFLKVPQFGQSKWASLQAVEKYLKAYIQSKNQEPERHHNLKKLINTAYGLGMEQFIDPDDISRIQVNAGVRYGEVKISLKEAVDAHHRALSICAGIAIILNKFAD